MAYAAAPDASYVRSQARIAASRIAPIKSQITPVAFQPKKKKKALRIKSSAGVPAPTADGTRKPFVPGDGD